MRSSRQTEIFNIIGAITGIVMLILTLSSDVLRPDIHDLFSDILFFVLVFGFAAASLYFLIEIIGQYKQTSQVIFSMIVSLFFVFWVYSVSNISPETSNNNNDNNGLKSGIAEDYLTFDETQEQVFPDPNGINEDDALKIVEKYLEAENNIFKHPYNKELVDLYAIGSFANSLNESIKLLTLSNTLDTLRDSNESLPLKNNKEVRYELKFDYEKNDDNDIKINIISENFATIDIGIEGEKNLMRNQKFVPKDRKILKGIDRFILYRDENDENDGWKIVSRFSLKE